MLFVHICVCVYTHAYTSESIVRVTKSTVFSITFSFWLQLSVVDEIQVCSEVLTYDSSILCLAKDKIYCKGVAQEFPGCYFLTKDKRSFAKEGASCGHNLEKRQGKNMITHFLFSNPFPTFQCNIWGFFFLNQVFKYL